MYNTDQSVKTQPAANHPGLLLAGQAEDLVPGHCGAVAVGHAQPERNGVRGRVCVWAAAARRPQLRPAGAACRAVLAAGVGRAAGAD